MDVHLLSIYIQSQFTERRTAPQAAAAAPHVADYEHVEALRAAGTAPTSAEHARDSSSATHDNNNNDNDDLNKNNNNNDDVDNDSDNNDDDDPRRSIVRSLSSPHPSPRAPITAHLSAPSTPAKASSFAESLRRSHSPRRAHIMYVSLFLFVVFVYNSFSMF